MAANGGMHPGGLCGYPADVMGCDSRTTRYNISRTSEPTASFTSISLNGGPKYVMSTDAKVFCYNLRHWCDIQYFHDFNVHNENENLL